MRRRRARGSRRGRGTSPRAGGASGYTEKLIEAVVGIEIVVARLEGKWKVSQNQPEANRAGVVAGLEARGGDEAAAMAALVAATAKAPRG